MSSITTWMRLEPNCRNADMSLGLQARIYDPLWLLARQWQLGEFEGDDSGSPAMARFRAEASRLSRFHAGPMDTTTITASQYDPTQSPLETMVERERVRPIEDPPPASPEKKQLAIDAGLHFFRILDLQQASVSYREVFTRKYALSALTDDERRALDGDSVAFLDLMAGRAVDGQKLYESLKPSPSGEIDLPSDLQIASVDVERTKKALGEWRQWYELIFNEPQNGESCWDPERMEYSFSVAAKLTDGEVALTAREYFQGHLDWYNFDVNKGSLGAANDNTVVEIKETTIPSPVTFRGAPANRFWEFEDARVDFGSIAANPEDLAQLLLVEFATTYGTDWFVVPVDMPIGSVCRSPLLIVTNTFGEQFRIRSATEPGAQNSSWRMFQLSSVHKPGEEPVATDLFFLPPSLMNSQESRSIEEVLFVRDEMANMAWAIEHVVESAIERPLNRTRQSASSHQDHQSNSGQLVYKLTSPVPENWLPLLPKRTLLPSPPGIDKGLRLERGMVLDVDGQLRLVEAKGRILNPEGAQVSLQLFEEEIPREGIQLSRQYQLARWQDGSTHLWIGRKKKVGRGEGSSGLRFDSLLRE